MQWSGDNGSEDIEVVAVLRTEDEIRSRWPKDSHSPKISVCCAVHNHAEFVEDALIGILSQETEFPFELIIHDDASTDNTLEVISPFLANYPELIRLVRQTDNQWSKGHRIFAEFMLPVVRAPFIALCEGDDFWKDPLKLAKQVAFLERNPDFVMCYTDCIGMSDSQGELTEVSGVRWDLSAKELQDGPSIFTLTACFRNVLGEWPRELSRSIYGDTMLWSLLGDHGRGKYLGDVMPSVYRIHDAGVHSMQSPSLRVERQLETYMLLFLYRMQQRQRSIAMRHLQDILVLSFKLERSRLFTGTLLRALAKLRRRFSAHG